LLLYSLLSRSYTGRVEGLSSSTYAIYHIIARNAEVVAPENGPNSAQLLEIQANCSDALYICLERHTGSWDQGMSLVIGTVSETVAVKAQQYLLNVLHKTSDFLSLSGQQFISGTELPSAVQCRTADEQADALTHASLTRRGWGWSLTNFPEERFEELREIWRGIRKVMCPPLPHVSILRDITDSLAFRYRSLGRPQPFLWYGALLILSVALPWARAYLPIVFTAGAIVLNHALISGIIGNVQPRYVVVINPLRAVLLGFLFYIMIRLVAWIVDKVREHRTARANEFF